jgi:vitamin K-dependent gamma-carboxylase
VSAASLAFVRIAFGIAMIVNVWLYIPVLVHEYYIDTTFNFPYEPLGFIGPPPGIGIYVAYVAMSVLGALIAIGLWYRAAMAAFFVLHTYVFLIDSTYFQNHEYLISLLSFLMIFLPAHRMWSVDARRRPAIASPTVPAVAIWILRFQIGVPYFFGAIAKMNADWFAGEPLRMWLARRTDFPIIGPWFTNEAVVWIMNYGSLIFDLVIVAFLLHPRTRLGAFIVATGFHLMNVQLFGLFIFPWLMIAATTIFFAPDWPLRLRAWWARKRGPKPEQPVGSTYQQPTVSTGAPRTGHRVLAVAIVAWVLVQVLMPLRHFVVPGNPNWTEETHRFAWHMKLRDKQGESTFIVTTADGRTVTVDPNDHLNRKQAFLMSGHPSRIVQFAHHLSELHGGAEVRVETSVSLNGRERVPLIDPDVNLAEISRWWWGHADWILPLEEPLRRE